MTQDPFEGTAYRGVEQIGGGGMGQVFRVEHRELGVPFAAKLLHARWADDPQVVDRMRLEAQTLGRLQHPNLVVVNGIETTRDGRPFLVMELLQGRTLEDTIDARGPLGVELSVSLARQLLAALAAAHAIGVVHRDVKPGNLFLHRGPRGETVLKLLDFGAALVLPGAARPGPRPLAFRTETGTSLGTPRFTSPEAAGGRRVDRRADVYGAGLVLYQMLTGRDPFQHVDDDELLLTAHAVEDPMPPSALVQGLPPALDLIVMRALQKPPSARIPSVEAFERLLAELASKNAETTCSPSVNAERTCRPSVRLQTPEVPGVASARSFWEGLEPTPAGGGVRPAAGRSPWLGLLVFLGAATLAAFVAAHTTAALRVLLETP